MQIVPFSNILKTIITDMPCCMSIVLDKKYYLFIGTNTLHAFDSMQG